MASQQRSALEESPGRVAPLRSLVVNEGKRNRITVLHNSTNISTFREMPRRSGHHASHVSLPGAGLFHSEVPVSPSPRLPVLCPSISSAHTPSETGNKFLQLLVNTTTTCHISGIAFHDVLQLHLTSIRSHPLH